MGGSILKRTAGMVLQGTRRVSKVNQPAQRRGQPNRKVSDLNPPTSKAEAQQVLQLEPSKYYNLAYEYDLHRDEKVFPTCDASMEIKLYDCFLRRVKKRMTTNYNAKEAELFCFVFRPELKEMFYKKMLQEIQCRKSKWGIDAWTAQENAKVYCAKLRKCRLELESLREQNPPPGFSAGTLWFGSFHDGPVEDSEGKKKQCVGSIYFDGGRIRLIHERGPCLDIGTRIRMFNGRLRRGGAIIYNGSDTVLKEYLTQEDIEADEYIHCSRGNPQKLELSDDEVRELYCLVERIGKLEESEDAWNTGNKILKHYFLKNQSLSKKLGYHNNMI